MDQFQNLKTFVKNTNILIDNPPLQMIIHNIFKTIIFFPKIKNIKIQDFQHLVTLIENNIQTYNKELQTIEYFRKNQNIDHLYSKILQTIDIAINYTNKNSIHNKHLINLLDDLNDKNMNNIFQSLFIISIEILLQQDLETIDKELLKIQRDVLKKNDQLLNNIYNNVKVLYDVMVISINNKKNKF